MAKADIQNTFGWLDEITVKKSHPNSFSQKSWDNWNSYMIHRWVSQNPSYIDIVNYVQKMNPQGKKEIYSRITFFRNGAHAGSLFKCGFGHDV